MSWRFLPVVLALSTQFLNRIFCFAHMYTLFKNGNILAIKKMLNIKGHNGVHPCHFCNIEGVCNITGKGTVYYVPLHTPTLVHPSHPSVNPNTLNLCTHREFVEIATRLSDPTLNKK